MGSSNKDESSTDVAVTNAADLSSDPTVFSEGEKVLAYHGPRIYEAKVQKVERRKKDSRYLVHYLGWNKNWDEWVGMDRLLKITDENVKKQQALEKKQGAEKNPKSGRSSQTKPKSSTDAKVDKEDPRNYGGRGKKRKGDSSIEEKDTVSMEKLVKIQIPMTLKKQLVNDWEYVTQQDKLVKLPRSPSVDDILKKYLDYKSKKDGIVDDISKKYLDYKSKKDGMIAESVGEILKGLRSYFDKVLPLMLLYNKEREQYHEVIADDVSPSSVYGAEHLLRLFVKLPELLAYANIEEETTTRLQRKLLDFLKFLQKNQSIFFLSNYNNPKGVEGSGETEEDE